MASPIVTPSASTMKDKSNSGGGTRNRACDACREHKVRCILDAVSVGKCQRCVRSGQACNFAPPQRRKQRKRTDTRVAELEREMKALRSLLDNAGGGSKEAMEGVVTSKTENELRPGPCNPRSSITLSDADQTSTPFSEASTGEQPYHVSNGIDLDVVCRGLLSMSLAAELYNTYITELSPHYPVVTFPEQYSAEQLRCEKPSLFLAVIAAAAGKVDPNLYGLLNTEALQVYATRVVISGEKSVELVQSMLVTAVWYYPPDKFDQLKFYQYVHLAATMALDIGIGSKPAKYRNGNPGSSDYTTASSATSTPISYDTSPLWVEEEFNTTTIDARRTFLACYLLCSGVALSMRRPNMLRFNSWMNDCVHFLEKLSNITIFDKRLIAWVRLQNIAEEFASSLSLEDPGEGYRPLDSRMQLSVKAFERRLKSWKNHLDPDVMNVSLLMMYYNIDILLHEVSLHEEHPAEDFRPPYFIGRNPSELSSRRILTAPMIDAVTACVTSSHALLDAFLAADIDTIRAMPVNKFITISYAAVVLTKLYLCSSNPHSNIGRTLDRDSLAVNTYSNSVLSQLAKASGPQGFRVPNKFLGILMRLQEWHQGPDSQNENDEMIQPLLCLNLQGPFDPSKFPSSAPATHLAATTTSKVIPSTVSLSSPMKMPATSSQIPGTVRSNNTFHNSSEYRAQYAPEPLHAHSDLSLMQELDLDCQITADTSLFMGINDFAGFTDDLSGWTQSVTVNGVTDDGQMLDQNAWVFERHL